ncbi:Na+/Ca+ antiporter, CaCA family [Desulfarculus baarsii DSM 2075]|uniref:Na+/Ca+ antiporter, CaCA family n=1 Tax=Desulfarculus baarsii (strain ATCC 33931 / DSM 2075 / LMG 7858 / VKM B-1802 / 2st14) TaxID=644282 RepID=E1QLV7_DESB2|nr:calcium/sodium antiporter [Desulfarculus baarsii]ADK86542.1 Na+/Ca+ antiporter, CaCA family [Desulfarculus baarsii DSM 2075]
MILPIVALIAGLILLVWSADRFVDGSAATARHAGMSPLLIGMVVVGFGTSAPEMVVSALSSAQGSPGIALGNAYGSNITNIALILGLSALVKPIAVQSGVLRKELPILSAVTIFAVALLWNGDLTRLDAALLLAVFAGLMAWTIWQGLRNRHDALDAEMAKELAANEMPLKRALTWVGVGLALLVGSSQLLVWGAVELARSLGVSDLIIGLTIVAVGTSLPELASSLAAARKGEHDIALGNVLGSNLFNTLAVVGIAGMIHPLAVEPAILWRDCMVMTALTLSLFVIGYGFRGPGTGRINRFEATGLLVAYVAYTAWLVIGAVKPAV